MAPTKMLFTRLINKLQLSLLQFLIYKIDNVQNILGKYNMFSLLLHFEVLLDRVSFDDPFGFHVDISIFRIRLKIAFDSKLKFRFE